MHACDASEHEDVREKNNERQSSLACYDLHMATCEAVWAWAAVKFFLFWFYSVSFQACKSEWQIFLPKQIWNQWHSRLTRQSFLVALAVMGLQQKPGDDKYQWTTVTDTVCTLYMSITKPPSTWTPVRHCTHIHIYTHTHLRTINHTDDEILMAYLPPGFKTIRHSR